MSDVYMEAVQAHHDQRFEEAELLYRQSLVLADKANNGPMIALTMHQLGRLAFEHGDLHRAMRRFKKLLQWQNAHKDARGQSRTCRQIAAIFDYRGDSVEALLWGKKALRLAEAVWSRHNMAEAYMLLGLLYFREKKLTEAVTSMRSSQEIWEELKDDDGFYRVSYRLAQLLLQRENIPLAIREFRRCLEILQQDDLEEAADIHHHISELCIDIGLFGESITHSLAALGRNRKLNAVELQDNVAVLLRIEDILGRDTFWDHISKHLDEKGTGVLSGILDDYRDDWAPLEMGENSEAVPEAEDNAVTVVEVNTPPVKSDEDSGDRIPEPIHLPSPEEVIDSSDMDKKDFSAEYDAENDDKTDEQPSQMEPKKPESSGIQLNITPVKRQVFVPEMPRFDESSVDDSSELASEFASHEDDTSPSIASIFNENPIIYTEASELTEADPPSEPIIRPVIQESSKEFMLQLLLILIGVFTVVLLAGYFVKLLFFNI